MFECVSNITLIHVNVSHQILSISPSRPQPFDERVKQYLDTYHFCMKIQLNKLVVQRNNMSMGEHIFAKCWCQSRAQHQSRKWITNVRFVMLDQISLNFDSSVTFALIPFTIAMILKFKNWWHWKRDKTSQIANTPALLSAFNHVFKVSIIINQTSSCFRPDTGNTGNIVYTIPWQTLNLSKQVKNYFMVWSDTFYGSRYNDSLLGSNSK